MGFNLQSHRELTQIETVEDTTLGIMKWGSTNSFPQTLVNLIEQSPASRPAVSRTAKFLKGSGFKGEDEIVNTQGLTLKRVVGILADDMATFEAFAIQTNWNMKGQVTGINPMRITDLRYNRFDELNYASKIGYHSNFGYNDVVRKTIAKLPKRSDIRWFDRFNPNVVMKQIEATEGGIGNYLGQILYHTESGYSSYPIPPLQAPVNHVLSDVENSILMRKESSTGFINSYLLKTTMDAEDPNLIALENAIIEAQGARGSGKVITLAGLTEADVKATLLEEIGGGAGSAGAIVDAIVKAFELSSKVINGAYLIPPILAGTDQKVGFSAPNLGDAYYVFNSITQGGRDTIEQEVNRVLAQSVFKTRSISINKLRLDPKVEDVEVTKDGEGKAVAVSGVKDMVVSQSADVVKFLDAWMRVEESKGNVPKPEDLIVAIKLYSKFKDV